MGTNFLLKLLMKVSYLFVTQKCPTVQVLWKKVTLVLFILMAFPFNLKNKSLCRLITVLPCALLHMSSIIFTPVFLRVTAGVARACLVTLAFCAKHLHESSVDFQGSIKMIRLTLHLLNQRSTEVGFFGRSRRQQKLRTSADNWSQD